MKRLLCASIERLNGLLGAHIERLNGLLGRNIERLEILLVVATSAQPTGGRSSIRVSPDSVPRA
jgi:hypothetical protein